MTTKDEAVALLKGQYGREIIKIAANYTSVIFWGEPSPRAGDSQITNGSIFFLDCGEGIFAVTADHVCQGYLKRKASTPRLVCQIGKIPFEPETRLIDRDDELDIATFRVDEKELVVDGKAAHKPSSWPPKPPDLEKGVFFAGFPGIYRNQLSPLSVEWRLYSGIATATSITDEYITCRIDRSDIVDTIGVGLPPEKQQLGGLSGAALWTLVETSIFSWRLGGIIYQYNPEFEIFRAKRPDRLKSNGQLSREA
jgi:hypothetical protein